MRLLKKHSLRRVEEVLNSLSHGVTALVAIAGLIMLIIYGAMSHKEWTLFSGIIYGISIVLLYTSSAFYHATFHYSKREMWRILDHCSIFILIAGTYTPILLVAIGGTAGWIMFGIQWGIALFGIVFKFFHTGKYEWISLLMYLAMGWMIIFQIGTLYASLPPIGFWMMVGGGLAYTFGVAFYMMEYIPFMHFIWHLFVMAGSLLHYFMTIWYVI